MREATIRWQWQPCSPRPARAAIAWHDAAERLRLRLQRMPVDIAGTLEATGRAGLLIVCGPTEVLPWVDGVDYAAPHQQAPSLWLPTRQEPDLPIEWLQQALQQQRGRQPVLLWPQPAAVIPLDRLLPLSPALLRKLRS